MASASTHVQIVDGDGEFDWEAVVQEIDGACQATAADKTTVVPNLSCNQGMVMNQDEEMWKKVNFDVNYRSLSSTRQTTLDRFIGGSSSNSRKFQEKAKVTSVINVSITRDNGGGVVWFGEKEKLNTFVKIDPEAAMTWIYHDVIEEILLRLPVKTLLQFKSVCSGWFSLIGSRSFAERQYLRQEKSNHLVVDFDGVDEYFDDYPDLRGKVRSYILGPVKGVVCEVREDATIILRNPATREMKTLPPLPVMLPAHLYVTKRISTRSLAYGFGLDPLSGAYKMVAFTKSIMYTAPACVVYNSTSNSWKHLHPRGVWDLERMLNAMPGARWSHRQSRFLNGVYYWLVRSHDCLDYAIFAFDMAREEFREVIAIPERGRLSFYKLRLAIYRGSLAAMTLYELGPCECVDMWVLVGDVWEYRFSSGPFQDMAWLRCLWSHTNRHELFLETLHFSDQIPADMSTRKLRMSVRRPSASDAELLDVLFPYKESIVSIQGHYTY